MAALRFFSRLLLASTLAGAGGGVHADTPIRLLQSYAGNVNFTGTQVTMRASDNSAPCSVYKTNEKLTATLAGIPAGATILSAQLYWAGSNYNPDYTVSFDNTHYSAPSDRRYYSYTGDDFNYYSGAVDVTARVRDKRNAEYTVKGMTVESGAPYCVQEGVVGGYSLLVIYSHSSEPYRVLNLYEGFQFLRYSSVTLNLANFKIPDPIGSATGRVAHITWEGDATLQQNGENLSFNGTAMTDAINPAQNQFNSKSNINGDQASYGIDFDAYTLASPVIASGQTTATTRYESGQDLVLLSAEIIALPNVPAADLSITMVRNNEMSLNKDVGYAITVKNSGPSTESGPVVVTDTLPVGLDYRSAGGTGWTCSVAGRVITCSNNTALAVGATLPVLTVTARVTTTGTLANSATVSGKMFDHVAANNSASASGAVADAGLNYVFTDKACTPGVAFGTGSQCKTVLTSLVAGETRVVYITATMDGVPTSLHKNKSISESFQFALSCHNPTSGAGVRAVYGGITLPPCASDGAAPTTWTASAVATFLEDQASVGANFIYEDVGEIQLFLRVVDTDKVGSASPFKSYPAEVRLTEPAYGGNPIPAAPTDTSTFLIKAGRDFTMTAGAYTTGGKLTPNFGRETTPEQFAMPAVTRGATAAMAFLPPLSGSFGAIAGGKATGTFQWNEVGLINLRPGLDGNDYLDDDIAVTANPVKIGRFIPDHFDTMAVAPMECDPKMKCAESAVGAAYSKQPFAVTVRPLSFSGSPTKNYTGSFARAVALSAVDAEGGSNLNPGGGALSAGAIASTAFKIVNAGDPEEAVEAAAAPVYTLPNAFLTDTPHAAQALPASIHLRAGESGGDGVTSNRGATDSQEAGLRIVSGRLLVPNGQGSERISLPLVLSAQYFSPDSQWELAQVDNASPVDSNKAVFSNFGGGMTAGVPSLAPKALQVLNAGATTFTLKLTPARAGRFDLIINDALWLPSTRGRFKFGVRTSPLIYLREAY